MRLFASLAALSSVAMAVLQPDYISPAGVEIYNPSTFFNATGPWSIMSKAGNTLYISGSYLLPMAIFLQKH
jgi:2-iminobutanoate/2-iminopropanoate deaminase